MNAELVADERLSELLSLIEADPDGAVRAADGLLEDYPRDPRLHFMKGSLLANTGRAIEAHRSLSHAVELAPDYALARYQLGFFELTSGEAEQALRTWAPLLGLEEGNPLRKFVEGMTHLVHDEFAAAVAALEEGIALNRENEPMNRDVRLLISECRRLLKASGEDEDLGEHSATSLMLSRRGGGTTLQ